MHTAALMNHQMAHNIGHQGRDLSTPSLGVGQKEWYSQLECNGVARHSGYNQTLASREKLLAVLILYLSWVSLRGVMGMKHLRVSNFVM